MEDLQIVSLYFARDQTAIKETDIKYGKLCYSVADAILHSKEDNEECVNDTYFTAWNKIPPEKPVYLSAFLCKITRNLSLKIRERRHAKKRNADSEISLSEIENILPNGQDLSEEIELRELGALISLFLRALPFDERNIFIRKYVLFHPIKIIAADFSFSQSKVKSMLARTRAKLAQYLKKYYGGINE